MTQPQNTLSLADQELLSAYIDQQLGALDQIALEKRLRAEPLLRAELQDLRAVRQSLADLPTLTAPRSFTISRERARRPALPLFGMLRFGSAAAALLLILSFAGDLVSFGGSSARAPMPASAPMPGAAPMQQQAADSGAAAPTAAKEPAATSAPADAAMSAPVGDTPGAGIREAPAAAAPAPAAEVQPTGAAAAGAQPDVAPPAAPLQSTRQAMSTAPGQIGESGSSSPGTHGIDLPPPQGSGQSFVAGLGSWRLAQIGLAVVALLLGLGAAFVRLRE